MRFSETNKRSMTTMVKKVTEALHEDLKKPLLINVEEEDEEERKEFIMQQMISPRVDSRQMSILVGGHNSQRRSTLANPHKNIANKVDKFASGMKTELLEQRKEEEEKRQRMLDD